MTFQIQVPSGALAGTYNLYFKVTADYYDAQTITGMTGKF